MLQLAQHTHLTFDTSVLILEYAEYLYKNDNHDHKSIAKKILAALAKQPHISDEKLLKKLLEFHEIKIFIAIAENPALDLKGQRTLFNINTQNIYLPPF